MNKFRFHIAILSAVVVLPFISTISVANGTTAQEIAAGKVLAEKLCARCHAVSTTGDSPESKSPPFREFAKKWPVQDLEEALAEGIVVGHKIMPEFEFEPDDITNLLSYIGSLAPAKTEETKTKETN